MKAKTHRSRWWIWLIAAAVLAAVCFLFYNDDGGGSSIHEIPGGFSLTVHLIEGPGQITRYDVTDAEQIKAVQGYIHTQRSARLPNRADAAPEYPFLCLSDGAGKTARRAVYTNGVWADSAGRFYTVTLDPAEVTALLPGVEPRPDALEDVSARFLAASVNGSWDARLLLPAPPPPDRETLEVRAQQRTDDKLSVTIHNPGDTAVHCRLSPRLDVQVDGVWYAVPLAVPDVAEDDEVTIGPDGNELLVLTSKDMEHRFGKLVPAHYRIVVLTYVSEFDV